MATNADVIIRIKAELKQATKQLNKVKSRLKVTGAQGAKSMQRLDKAMASQDLAQKRLARVTQGTKKAFAGWAMSIMFFGMAIKRVFDTIWKSSTKTFQDVMHSTEGTVTKFDMLEGSIKYLGFTAGEALEPVAAFLVPIIDSVTDWINNNESLFATLIVIAGVLGTILMTTGMLVLAWDGLKVFGPILKSLVSPVTLIAAALLALAGISWKAFSETPEAWDAVKNSMGELLDGPLSDMKDSLLNLIDTIFPDLDLSWAGFAWGAAWALDIILRFIGLLANEITLVNNLLNIMLLTLKMIGDTFSGRGISIADSTKLKSLIRSVAEHDTGGYRDLLADVVAGPNAYRDANTVAPSSQTNQVIYNNFAIEQQPNQSIEDFAVVVVDTMNNGVTGSW